MANSDSNMKNKTRILTCLGLAILSAFISGCIQMPRNYGTIWHANISPIYPPMNYSFYDRYQTINTLKPQLKWKDVKKANQTYDLCIWETSYKSVEDIKQKAVEKSASWGRPVYTTNNIADNFHQVTLQLKPDTYYNWSVRIRDGEKFSPWSSFTQVEGAIGATITRSQNPFGFKTPAQ